MSALIISQQQINAPIMDDNGRPHSLKAAFCINISGLIDLPHYVAGLTTQSSVVSDIASLFVHMRRQLPFLHTRRAGQTTL